jgi:hypothetical protein
MMRKLLRAKIHRDARNRPAEVREERSGQAKLRRAFG